MKKMNFLDWIAMILIIVGALNWGLVGIFNFNLVSAIFGDGSALSRIVFTLVGLAAIYSVVSLPVKSMDKQFAHPSTT